VDDSGQDLGQISGGWDLFVTTDTPTDTTSPRVTSTVPQPGATGVSPTATVRAAFSEEMTDSAVNATTFKLFKKGSTTKVAATVIYDGAAKDLAGNRLDQNPNLSGQQQKAWTFKVRR
jgi:hypothetical protein